MPERAPNRRSIGCARGRRGRALALGWALVAGLLLAPVGRGTTRPPSAAAQASVLDIDVTVRGIARLYAAEIGLRFDPTQVTPVDAMPSRPGLQLAAGSGWGGSPFTLVNAIDAPRRAGLGGRGADVAVLFDVFDAVVGHHPCQRLVVCLDDKSAQRVAERLLHLDAMLAAHFLRYRGHASAI